MLIFGLPSLTLSALIKFRVRPWPMYFFAGQLAKNLYRKDAKTAKKQQISSDFLFYFALFASSR